MSEDKIFSRIMLNNKLLSECEPVYKGKHDNSRLYVLKKDNEFFAHAVDYKSCPASNEKDHWKNNSLIVNTIFEVVAYHDGVRHLEWNRNGGEMDGYIYYPIMTDIISMLQKVREIELEVCSNIDT